MKQRTVSALLALPILFLILFSQNYMLIGGVLLLLSLTGMYELYSSFKDTEHSLDKPFWFLGYASAIALYIERMFLYKNYILIILACSIFLIIACGMFTYNKKTLSNIAITVLSIFYIPCFFRVIYNIYFTSPWLVGYVFLIAFGSDTCAYFVGVLFGKRKITPVLSPNKSLEGFIGGMLGCVLIVLLYTVALSKFNLIKFDYTIIYIVKFAIFGFMGAIVSQIGDLLASSIKRTNGIKDYGNIMPGHGGVLDRFDSILLVAPYVYFIINIIF